MYLSEDKEKGKSITDDRVIDTLNFQEEILRLFEVFQKDRKTVLFKDAIIEHNEDCFFGVLEDVVIKLLGGRENLFKIRCEFLGGNQDRCERLKAKLIDAVAGLVTVKRSVNIETDEYEDLLKRHKDFEWETETLTY